MEQVLFYVDFALMILCAAFYKRALAGLLDVKKYWWSGLLAFGACWLIAGMVIYIGDWINIVPTLAGFLVVIYISCEGSSLKRIVIGLMIASTIFSFNAVTDNFMIRWMDAFLYARLLFAMLLYAGVRKFAPKKGYELAPAMWKLLLLLTLTPIGMVLSIIVLGKEWYAIPENQSMYLALLLIALFSFVGLLWTVTVLVKQKNLEEQNVFAQMNQKYYETMEQQHFEIRRMKHDLANHLQAVAILPLEQKDAYIRELLDNTGITQTLDYCADGTVNAVLTTKESLMHQNGITFEKQIDIPKEIPIEKADLCAVFANALDNAIEALERECVERKEIIMESRARKGMLVLSVKNPTTAQMDGSNTGIRAGKNSVNVKKEILLQTSKADRKNHGFGIHSMKEIVERHGGELEIKIENGWFELFLYFPI